MRVALMIILFIVCSHSYGQNISYDVFLQQKRNIDSLTKQIDANQELIERHMTGEDSIYGQYNGKFFYKPQDNSIGKMECTFSCDPISVNLFYFQNDSLVKISYEQKTLYCIDDIIVDDVGTEVKVGEGSNLWLFQNRTKLVLKSILED